jgi:hypothetical protein
MEVVKTSMILDNTDSKSPSMMSVSAVLETETRRSFTMTNEKGHVSTDSYGWGVSVTASYNFGMPLIGPSGGVAFTASGEGRYDETDTTTDITAQDTTNSTRVRQ